MAYIGTSPANGVRRKHTYTATAGQTSFSGADDNNVTLTYVDTEYLDVYQNGVKLVAVSDYASTTGTSVVLTQGASVSDIIEIIVFDIFSVADTVSAGSGGSFGGNIGVGGTLSVTGGIVSPVTINGTTPTLTIGDAGAEDTKIVFDGNAQDYHIGLDDSADTLVIGKGSALGTTTAMSFDANGIITKPLQPAFLANPSATLANFAIENSNNVNFATERFDRNADYNAGGSPSAFTAPVTGVYQLNFTLYILALDTAAAYVEFAMVTSNRSFNTIIDPNFSGDLNYYHMTMSVLADMDASDTAKITMWQQGGTAQLDLAANSTFSGYLVG